MMTEVVLKRVRTKLSVWRRGPILILVHRAREECVVLVEKSIVFKNNI
jgi:hypothetical protein